MIDAFAQFFGIAVGYLLALEVHDWRKRRRVNPEETPSAIEVIATPFKKLEKAEFMPPMNDEEYEDWIASQSSRGELMAKLKRPWKSDRPPSPSSDG